MHAAEGVAGGVPVFEDGAVGQEAGDEAAE